MHDTVEKHDLRKAIRQCEVATNLTLPNWTALATNGASKSNFQSFLNPIWRSVAAASLFVVSLSEIGCVPLPRQFQVAKAIAPETPSTYRRVETVDTLQPELKWEGTSVPDNVPGRTWELCIWDTSGSKSTYIGGAGMVGSPSRYSTPWGTPVYARTGITSNSHRVEQPLKPDTIYYWSVRSRIGDTVSPWASYFQAVIVVGLGAGSAGNVPFAFKTPKAP